MSAVEEMVVAMPASSLATRARVIQATTTVELAAVRAIRQRVFADEQRMVAKTHHDPDDRRGIHALALASEGLAWRPVGTGRLTLNFGDHGEALIAWVATLPEARQAGVGTAVMRFLLDATAAADAPVVALAAQTHAERFYRRLGFQPVGRRYFVEGVEHTWMAKYRHC